MMHLLLILLTTLQPIKEDSCKKITIISSENFATTKTYEFNLRGFGRIPFNASSTYQDNSPFTFENNCLEFGISHGGCGCTFDLIWDGTLRKDKDNRTIADIKFILFYKEPCKRLISSKQKYDLSEIINKSKTDILFLNFIGYDKLIKVK